MIDRETERKKERGRGEIKEKRGKGLVSSLLTGEIPQSCHIVTSPGNKKLLLECDQQGNINQYQYAIVAFGKAKLSKTSTLDLYVDVSSTGR